MKHLKLRLLILITFFFVWVIAETPAPQAIDIIRLADDIRSPNVPFRYTVTVLEYKEGASSRRVNKFSMYQCVL